MSSPNPEQRLEVEIVDGRLVISIGINVMCHAIQLGPYFGDDDLRITDNLEFARSVRNRLVEEEEDGSTLIHRALNRAAQNAIESGDDGVDFDD